jgi:antitoxin component of RelBE/YafQ-DinJ toxin-antitoxin module
MNKVSTESIISFSAPTPLKHRLQQFADDNGVSVSVIVRMSVMQTLRNGINIVPELEPNESLRHAIKKADNEYATAKSSMDVIATPADVDDYFAS